MYTIKLSTQAVDTFLTTSQTFKETATLYYCMYLEMEVGAFSMESESDCLRPEGLKISVAEWRPEFLPECDRGCSAASGSGRWHHRPSVNDIYIFYIKKIYGKFLIWQLIRSAFTFLLIWFELLCFIVSPCVDALRARWRRTGRRRRWRLPSLTTTIRLTKTF